MVKRDGSWFVLIGAGIILKGNYQSYKAFINCIERIRFCLARQ
jgi:hypothetical protein